MIPARLLSSPIHALLDYRPMTVVGDDEAVQVQIEAILHGGAVHLGHKPAGLRKFPAVEADPIPYRDELLRRLPRVLPAPAANVNPELLLQRRQPALQRPDHARRDAR